MVDRKAPAINMRRERENIDDGQAIRVTEDTIEEIFGLAHDKLVVLATRIIGSRDDAKDVVFEVWGKLWNGRENLEFCDEFALTSYLFTGVRMKAIDWLRKKGTQTETLKGYKTISDQEESPAAFRGEMVTVASIAEFYKELENLPPFLRSVVNFRLEGKSTKEIAIAMGISEGSVRAYLSRAAGRLSERLNGNIGAITAMLALGIIETEILKYPCDALHNLPC